MIRDGHCYQVTSSWMNDGGASNGLLPRVCPHITDDLDVFISQPRDDIAILVLTLGPP